MESRGMDGFFGIMSSFQKYGQITNYCARYLAKASKKCVRYGFLA